MGLEWMIERGGKKMDFRYRLMRFFMGRYGADETAYVLFGISAVLAISNIFLRLWYLQIIIYLIMAFAIYRMFSHNIAARTKENRVVKNFLSFLPKRYNTYKTRKADKTHIYKKCPGCKAVLRLPRRKGKHTTVCPNCHLKFSVKVYKE